MKSPFLILLLMILSPIVVTSQEIKMVSSVLSSGGNIQKEGQTTLSKWRIGEVQQLIIKDMHHEIIQTTDWQISAYPNPVINLLNLKFSIQKNEDFTIEISDILGKNLFTKPIHQVNIGDVIQIDMSAVKTGLYSVKIWNSNKSSFSFFKVIKH